MSEQLRQADEGFHEIQLSGKQLVFLFMATTIVAVVIFLCGVLVGRGVRSGTPARTDAAPPAEPASVAQAAPPVAAPPPTANGTSAADRVAAAPPPAAATPAPAGKGQEDLSYHRRLQGDAAAGTASSPEDRLKPREEPAALRETAPAPPPAAQAPPPANGWMVQIAALRDRAAADAIVKRLSAKGYPTVVIEPAAGAPAASFRIRVGPYADRAEAERIARRLEREEQFRPFITR
ncbi:MAG TPA: SPOR domain-containing protein [Vicinamibacterales bacterium]|nr:SPOR domain-containing protein [Vicinamibacterales bacterium]